MEGWGDKEEKQMGMSVCVYVCVDKVAQGAGLSLSCQSG